MNSSISVGFLCRLWGTPAQVFLRRLTAEDLMPADTAHSRWKLQSRCRMTASAMKRFTTTMRSCRPLADMMRVATQFDTRLNHSMLRDVVSREDSLAPNP